MATTIREGHENGQLQGVIVRASIGKSLPSKKMVFSVDRAYRLVSGTQVRYLSQGTENVADYD